MVVVVGGSFEGCRKLVEKPHRKGQVEEKVLGGCDSCELRRSLTRQLRGCAAALRHGDLAS